MRFRPIYFGFGDLSSCYKFRCELHCGGFVYYTRCMFSVGYNNPGRGFYGSFFFRVINKRREGMYYVLHAIQVARLDPPPLLHAQRFVDESSRQQRNHGGLHELCPPESTQAQRYCCSRVFGRSRRAPFLCRKEDQWWSNDTSIHRYAYIQ